MERYAKNLMEIKKGIPQKRDPFNMHSYCTKRVVNVCCLA